MHPRPLRTALAAAGLSCLCLLAACGGSGGDGDDTTPIEARNDTPTVALGGSAQLLANDTLGGAAASSATVSFELTAGALPAGVTVDAGLVTVAADAVPGSLTLNYRICEIADPANCASASATLTIPAPPIVAVDDALTLGIGASGDVLANDTLGGSAAAAGTVGVSATSALPAGIMLSAGGVLSVGSGSGAGTYGIDYRICQTIAPTNCDTATAQVTVPALGALTGRAIDAATGLGVPGVSVSVGAASTTTDANGGFMLSAVSAVERASVVFYSDAYAESARVAAVTAGGNTDVQVRLLRIAATSTIDAATGGVATVPGSTAQVQLPANAVQRSDGSAPVGAMTVQLTPIDPASDSTVMPGDFTTIVGGTPAPIESFGALNVQLFDQDGEALNLRSGQTSTIRIPLASRNSSPPATIPLFYFDSASARWVQEGTATRVGSGAGAYYEGTVGHFSTWNADLVVDTVNISGCVVDATGAPVAGAVVASDGIDYSGSSSVFTDTAGNFVLPIRRGSQATVVASSLSVQSNTLRIGPFTIDSALSACLSVNATTAGITMKLTWGARPSDLDSHLYAPDGRHVYYSNRGSLTAAPFANLDVDDVTSYGPEVVTITRLMVGTYKYAVYNYSRYASGSITAANARVELNLPGRNPELFTPPAGETASTNWWTLFELDVDERCNVTVRRIGAFAASGPVASSAPAVYCTP